MQSLDLTCISIGELIALIGRRDVSPVELVSAHLERIERVNPQLNAIVTLAPDLQDKARQAEKMVMSGQDLGPLHGVPLTIKDTIATAGLRTTSGSLLRKDFVPTVDADAVARLKTAGAIIVGKTNTPEMAIPYETDNPVFGRTNNPYDLHLTPGGSSGGEAAAIAAGLSPGGVGSDLSGSIRVPAHFCGIVGLKPTSGRIPMRGHVPIAEGPLSHGACIGPMARRVADVRLLFQVLAETEGAEPVTPNQLNGLRLCWYNNDGVSPVSSETEFALKAAVGVMEDAGLHCIERRPAPVMEGARLWIDLFAETSARDLRSFYSGAQESAGPLARKILNSGVHQNRPLELAFQERNRLRNDLLTEMDDTPVLISPVGASPAFAHNTNRITVGEETLSVFRSFSYSQTFNVYDLPSLVVRVGQTSMGLPIGVQIVGKPFNEGLILAVASILEDALGGWQAPFNAHSDPI